MYIINKLTQLLLFVSKFKIKNNVQQSYKYLLIVEDQETHGALFNSPATHLAIKSNN